MKRSSGGEFMAGSMEVPSNSFVAAAGAASFFPAASPPSRGAARQTDTATSNPAVA
jgi:hypothetical protein